MTSTTKAREIQILIVQDIMKKVGVALNLQLTTGKPHEWQTQVFGRRQLDNVFLAELAKSGFTFEPGSGKLRKDMIYLVGHSDQGKPDIFESDYWAFRRTEQQPYLTICMTLSINEKKRGVVAKPSIWGNCQAGASHQHTIDRLAIAIGKSNPNLHTLVTEMANTHTYPVIRWVEIGLGGLRSLMTLFREVYDEREVVKKLANSALSPFQPNPYQEEGHYRFVSEIDQLDLCLQWEKQLEDFKNKL